MNEHLDLWFLQLTATAILTGFIWVIQWVVYPGFSKVGSDHFKSYHAFYTRRVSLLVFVFMVAEMAVALWIFKRDPGLLWPQINLGSIFIVWIITAAWAGPLHTKLAKGAPLEKIQPQLLVSNFLRSAVWTLRLAALVWVLILANPV